MPTFLNLSWEDKSNFYQETLITACSETNKEKKPQIKVLMAQITYPNSFYPKMNT